jgi:hypothetical protein
MESIKFSCVALLHLNYQMVGYGTGEKLINYYGLIKLWSLFKASSRDRVSQREKKETRCRKGTHGVRCSCVIHFYYD